MEDMGRKLRFWRLRTRWTLQDVADHCKCSAPTICSFERGRHKRPRRELIDKVSRLIAEIDYPSSREAERILSFTHFTSHVRTLLVWRQENGISQEKVAKLVGVSRQYYNQIEIGKAFPGDTIRVRIGFLARTKNIY